MEFPYVDIHTHKNRDKQGVVALHSALYGRETDCTEGLCSCGIHPWDADKLSSDTARKFLMQSTNCAAIGETGFDFTQGRHHEQQQTELFRLHLDAATELGLPLMVHCVKGYDELIREINLHHPKPVAVIIHGFRGSEQQTVQLAQRQGFYLSYGALLGKSDNTRRAIRATPPGKLLLETDDSAMEIEEVYALAADALGTTLQELKKRIYSNYKKIFHDDDK